MQKTRHRLPLSPSGTSAACAIPSASKSAPAWRPASSSAWRAASTPRLSPGSSCSSLASARCAQPTRSPHPQKRWLYVGSGCACACASHVFSDGDFPAAASVLMSTGVFAIRRPRGHCHWCQHWQDPHTQATAVVLLRCTAPCFAIFGGTQSRARKRARELEAWRGRKDLGLESSVILALSPLCRIRWPPCYRPSSPPCRREPPTLLFAPSPRPLGRLGLPALPPHPAMRLPCGRTADGEAKPACTFAGGWPEQERRLAL